MRWVMNNFHSLLIFVFLKLIFLLFEEFGSITLWKHNIKLTSGTSCATFDKSLLVFTFKMENTVLCRYCTKLYILVGLWKSLKKN